MKLTEYQRNLTAAITGFLLGYLGVIKFLEVKEVIVGIIILYLWLQINSETKIKVPFMDY